jgi:hypothetical protein
MGAKGIREPTMTNLENLAANSVPGAVETMNDPQGPSVLRRSAWLWALFLRFSGLSTALFYGSDLFDGREKETAVTTGDSIVVMWAAVNSQTDEINGSRANLAVARVKNISQISLHLVDETIAVLSQGWSDMSPVEREKFLQIFDPSGTGEVDEQYVAEVLGNYRKIRRTLLNDIPVVYAPQSDKCIDQRLYYTYLLRVYVCPYFFEEENDLRKARTLIHEMAHQALLVNDRPYYNPTSKHYARLTPYGHWAAQLPLVGHIIRELLRGDTLYHPDAYAHYALLGAGYRRSYSPKEELRQDLQTADSGFRN